MINVEQILNDYGKELVARLQNDIRTKRVTKYGAVNASGDLASSIRYEVNGSVMTIYGNDYIYYLQYGRKSGKRPPTSVIKQWIDDKGITPKDTYIARWKLKDGTIRTAERKYSSAEAAKDSFAYMIAKKIGEEGTTIWQQGGSDLVSGIFNEELQKEIENSFANLLVTEIQSDILKLAA